MRNLLLTPLLTLTLPAFRNLVSPICRASLLYLLQPLPLLPSQACLHTAQMNLLKATHHQHVCGLVYIPQASIRRLTIIRLAQRLVPVLAQVQALTCRLLPYPRQTSTHRRPTLRLQQVLVLQRACIMAARRLVPVRPLGQHPHFQAAAQKAQELVLPHLLASLVILQRPRSSRHTRSISRTVHPTLISWRAQA